MRMTMLALLFLLGCRSTGHTEKPEYPALRAYAIRRGVDLNSRDFKESGASWQDYLYSYSQSHGPIFNPNEKREYEEYNKKSDGQFVFSGDPYPVYVVKSEFKKLFLKNPVPYSIEIRCLKDGTGGYYRRGGDGSEKRLIVVCGSEPEELVRLIRHEYQHCIDELKGVEPSSEREERAKKSEK